MLDSRKRRLRDWLVDDLQACAALYPYKLAAGVCSELPQLLAARVHRVRLDATAMLLLRDWR